MIPECKATEAVQELLKLDEPENYAATLDDLFETWLGSDLINGTTGNMRYMTHMHIKALKKLMDSIK